MKRIILLMALFAATLTVKTTFAQNTADFHGAEADLPHYKALYILNTADEKHIRGTLRNLNNALEDPRLKGKLEVELIAFGDGVTVYQKSSPYEEILKALQAKGVLLAQCENTIRERKIDKNDLFPFIAYVPSGNGEIIIRQHQGWATVHP